MFCLDNLWVNRYYKKSTIPDNVFCFESDPPAGVDDDVRGMAVALLMGLNIRN